MSATSLEPILKRAAETIERADAMLITAGAGIGVDSGLPDFRGALIRINPREPDVPAGHLSVPLNAGEGLRKILK